MLVVKFFLEIQTYIRYNHKSNMEQMFDIYNISTKPLILIVQKILKNSDVKIIDTPNYKFRNSKPINNRIGLPIYFIEQLNIEM